MSATGRQATVNNITELDSEMMDKMEIPSGDAPTAWNIVEGLAGLVVAIFTWSVRTTVARIEREQYSIKNDLRGHSDVIAKLLERAERTEYLPNEVDNQGRHLATLEAKLGALEGTAKRIEDKLDRALERTTHP